MEPKEACAKATRLMLEGNLQGAIDILDPILDEFREFGPAYVVHARVFLMAGDCAQPLVDLEAAEWANREYGTPQQVQEVTEMRVLTYAIRSIYGGQNEANKCREQVEELMKQRATPESFWFLPAVCYELAYKEKEAQDWVNKMMNYEPLKSAAGFFFTKRAGLTQLLAMPKEPKALVPVHYARHYRAKREGDKKGAEKYRKRMEDLLEPADHWAVVNLYASGAVVVSAV
ncbi:MAG: hypothetical protein KF696_05775 [Planctomycetes bacterium]|nr:hypothetical protein [Planctomycetota bacterium]MCW8136395.1 hypothetical protein [Planctomycetota bacterium]